jgi:AraC-like DNA-binding protein
VPMHRYLMLARLGHARRLLQSGLRAVEVAHEVGFSDAAHMGRIFRTDFGFTPGAYARADGR